MYTLKRVPLFHEQQAPEPDSWPQLSVLVPACNEAEHIASAVNTLIAQDYPALEIILVNDRSTDGTGEIIDRLARQDKRIKSVHIETLPEGWLGKVHALHQGTAKASGDWLLFTDADVHFVPGVLRRAIALAVIQRVDHLTMIPKVVFHTFWIELAVRAFGYLFMVATHVESINKPDTKAFVGVGAFNLVRARVFRRTPGFEWLRLEPADDAGLGLMLKQAGGRTFFALALEDIWVSWYPTLLSMFKGLEKNGFGPGTNYQLWRLLVQVVSLWALVAAPVIALVFGFYLGSTPSIVAGTTAISVHLIFSILFIDKHRSETFKLLLLPVGLFIVSLMMVWAGYQCIKNDGIDWRGTHYPREQLKLGQRVKF